MSARPRGFMPVSQLCPDFLQQQLGQAARLVSLENGFNRWKVVQTSLFGGTSVSTKRVLFAHQSPWDQAPAWQIQPRGGFVWYRMIQTCNSDRMVGTQIKCPGNSRVAITATDTVESE